jgi:hypothetical protein
MTEYRLTLKIHGEATEEDGSVVREPVVRVTELQGSAEVIANILRTLADDMVGPVEPVCTKIHYPYTTNPYTIYGSTTTGVSNG